MTSRNDVEDAVPETSIISLKRTSTEKHKLALLGLVVFIVAFAGLVIGSVALKRTNDMENQLRGITGGFPIYGDNDPNSTSSASKVSGSTRLFSIQERGHLNCGVVLSNGLSSKTEGGGLEGFDIDLVSSVS